MTYDFTVIPGNSGIETNDLGLVLRHKDAKGAVIDLTGATLHFTANYGSTNVLSKSSPDITWDSQTGEIVVPFSVDDTREIGKHVYVKYGLEYRSGDEQRIIISGKINIKSVPNAD